MAGNSYWAGFTRVRLARRRLLAGGSAALGVALALSAAGCGGGESDGDGAKDSSGLIAKPIDALSQAKAGGTFKDFQAVDILHFDASASNSAAVVNQFSIFAYPRLLKWVTAKYPKEAEGASEGDLAESFEVSGDKLQITFKLRPNLKWDNRAPTSGRAAEAQDVLTSWKRYTALNPSAQDLAYSEKSPGAAIESVTAPDVRTVVMKLKKPDSSVLQLLTAWAHFYVMPKEADGGFDPKTEARGHGPWVLDEYIPSARTVWKRNPDYYVKDRPFPEKWERPIIQDYAQQLAQFKAGNIWTTVARQEDIVQAKKDVMQTLLLQGESFGTGAGPYVSFGWEGDSPFKDVRVRQALGMLLDGEAYADVIENRDGFRRQGLDLVTGYNSIVPAGWLDYSLDPRDEKKFGSAARFIKFNIAESKKLTAAAGFPNGVEARFIYNAGLEYGAIYHKVAEVMDGMFAAGGFKLQRDPLPYRQFFDGYFQGYLSQLFSDGKVKGFNGLMLRAGRSFPTVAAQLFGSMHHEGSVFHGLTPDGRNAHLGDAKVDQAIDRMKLEYDIAKQQEMCHELVRYYTQQAYHINRPISAKQYELVWPVIGNYGITRTWPSGNNVVETRRDWWVNSSKPPLARA
jgi:peptide/nickel transport system substrate-binding protein